MLATGWDRAQLGRQPAAVIRRVCWRLFAERQWRPDLLAAARGPVPPITDTSARSIRAEAMAALVELEQLLFPDDD